MFHLGSRIKVQTPPTAENPRGLWVPQVIIDEPSQVTVTKVVDGVERRYLNMVAPVLARHPVTGALYIRPLETLNFSLPRFTDVVGLDITEDGEVLVQRTTAGVNIQPLMEFFERWTEANPAPARAQGASIEA